MKPLPNIFSAAAWLGTRFGQAHAAAYLSFSLLLLVR
jgi:hypothetical protein